MTPDQKRAIDEVSTAAGELAKIEDAIGPDVLRAAELVRAALAEMDDGDPATRDAISLLALRITTETPDIDDPRFDAHDYADAVANATIPVDVVALSELDPTSLETCLVVLAAHKRETYENRPHETLIPPELPLKNERTKTKRRVGDASAEELTPAAPPVHEYSVCFLFSPDGNSVLLQTKDRTSFAGRLNGVGGKREPGETMPRCALREIKEETGVDVDERDLVHVAAVTLHEDCTARDEDATCVLHFFATTVDPRDVNPPAGATEPVRFYDTTTVLNAPVRHSGLAGFGDVQYVVNIAYRTLNLRGRFFLAGHHPRPRLAGIRTSRVGRHLSIVDAEYEMPDHTIKTYEIATRHPDADIRGHAARPDGVSILLFDASGDHVLLEREFRMAVGEYVYNLPMGLVEDGERPEEAILRELREETGIRGVQLSRHRPVLPTAYTAPGMSNQSDQLFVGFVEARRDEPFPSAERPSPSPHEFVQPIWMDRAGVASILYCTTSERTPFSSRTQALLHGWLCGADYVRRKY